MSSLKFVSSVVFIAITSKPLTGNKSLFSSGHISAKILFVVSHFCATSIFS